MATARKKSSNATVMLPDDIPAGMISDFLENPILSVRGRGRANTGLTRALTRPGYRDG
jgi:hypothetical protein